MYQIIVKKIIKKVLIKTIGKINIQIKNFFYLKILFLNLFKIFKYNFLNHFLIV